ncbi:hypothetical protein L7F22_064454, partial [Adiantum nelumboides]|nr:hypothetical protein [Adiantum nelumboides]
MEAIPLSSVKKRLHSRCLAHLRPAWTSRGGYAGFANGHCACCSIGVEDEGYGLWFLYSTAVAGRFWPGERWISWRTVEDGTSWLIVGQLGGFESTQIAAL